MVQSEVSKYTQNLACTIAGRPVTDCSDVTVSFDAESSHVPTGR
jgi:hypothetical protein